MSRDEFDVKAGQRIRCYLCGRYGRALVAHPVMGWICRDEHEGYKPAPYFWLGPALRDLYEEGK